MKLGLIHPHFTLSVVLVCLGACAHPNASRAPDAPPAATTAPAGPTTKGGASTLEISATDPVSMTGQTFKGHVGDDVVVTLPEYPGTSWSLTSVDRAFAAPREGSVAGWVGPTTPGHTFRWRTTDVTGAAGTHRLEFTNRTSTPGDKGGSFVAVVVLEG